MPVADVLKALAVVTIFGCNFVAAKVGVHEFTPLVLMVLRFVVVLAVTLPATRFPTRADLPPLVAAALLLGCGHFGCLFVGLKGLHASVAALMIQFQVPLASVLATVARGERMPALGWVGMFVSLGGVVLLGGDPKLEGSAMDFGLVLVAGVSWAAAQLYLQRLGHLSPHAKNASVAAVALPVLALASLATEEHQMQVLRTASVWGWVAVLYMAIASTVVAYGLWFGLIHRHPVNRVVPFILLVPVFAVIASVTVLGDPVTWELLAGGALVVGGVAMTLLAQSRT